jgi:RNA polymerase sigma-70 factor (ECF subfamily)
MGFADTTLGGPDRAFPTTQWSQVLGAQDPARFDALVRAYWKPAYAYIRVAWKKSNEDAKDLTQAFFARLLQNGRLGAVRTEGGRFRSYLKQALRNFLIDAERAAEVRRPVEPVFTFETDPIEVASGETPDRVFDREWCSCLLEASLRRLERQLAEEGKAAYFEAFRAYLLDPQAEREVTVATRGGELGLPTYASVARRLGRSESDVRNYLSHCRARLREILKDEVRGTVEDSRDAEDELRSLIHE